MPLKGLRIKETKEVYEGEVTEMTAEETENPMGGYGKTIAHVVIGLKTVKGTKQLKLDPTIYERSTFSTTLLLFEVSEFSGFFFLFGLSFDGSLISLQKERVNVGDVIYIEANSGSVKRVGRSDAYATEFDL